MAKDFSVDEISRITGISAATLRALARGGRLPGAYKLGGRWLVNREEFERYRNGNGGSQQPEPVTSAVKQEG